MISHNLSFDVACSVLFAGQPLLEQPAAARTAGFDAVEFRWPFATAVPGDGDVVRFVAALEDAGTMLVGLNFFAGNLAAGDRGLVAWPGREREFRDNVDIVVGIGQMTGCRSFTALYGNRLPGVNLPVQEGVAIENLGYAARAINRIGGIVLVEPLSGPEPYPLRTAADVIAVLDRAEAAYQIENIRLLADFYHLASNGDDLDNVIATVGRRIGHVQIADVPGRNEPGTGRLPIDQYLLQLERSGYHGWVGLEYIPSHAPDPFAWLPKERRGALSASKNNDDSGQV